MNNFAVGFNLGGNVAPENTFQNQMIALQEEPLDPETLTDVKLVRIFVEREGKKERVGSLKMENVTKYTPNSVLCSVIKSPEMFDATKTEEGDHIEFVINNLLKKIDKHSIPEDWSNEMLEDVFLAMNKMLKIKSRNQVFSGSHSPIVTIQSGRRYPSPDEDAKIDPLLARPEFTIRCSYRISCEHLMKLMTFLGMVIDNKKDEEGRYRVACRHFEFENKGLEIMRMSEYYSILLPGMVYSTFKKDIGWLFRDYPLKTKIVYYNHSKKIDFEPNHKVFYKDFGDLMSFLDLLYEETLSTESPPSEFGLLEYVKERMKSEDSIDLVFSVYPDIKGAISMEIIPMVSVKKRKRTEE